MSKLSSILSVNMLNLSQYNFCKVWIMWEWHIFFSVHLMQRPFHCLMRVHDVQLSIVKLIANQFAALHILKAKLQSELRSVSGRPSVKPSLSRARPFIGLQNRPISGRRGSRKTSLRTRAVCVQERIAFNSCCIGTAIQQCALLPLMRGPVREVKRLYFFLCA